MRAKYLMNDRELELELGRSLFPPLPRVDLVPERTALLTIDLQYLDAHPDYGVGRRAKESGNSELLRPYFEDVARLVSNVQMLQATARRVHMQNIHICISPHTQDARDCPPISRMRGARAPRSSRENDILDDVRPYPDEIVLRKISSSAFLSTDLNLVLRNMAIDTVVCCGVVTSGCIESTARNARDLGYKVVVVSDGCASWTRDLHERSLRFISCNVGNVLTAREVVAAVTSDVPA